MTVKMDLSLIIYEFVVFIILSHCIQPITFPYSMLHINTFHSYLHCRIPVFRILHFTVPSLYDSNQDNSLSAHFYR